MTPAQRKYDQDLIASMRQVSDNVASRSRKMSDLLKIAADRMDALLSAVPVDQPEPQPASTLDRANKLEPVRD